jgi:hypothetical protein
MTSAQLHATRHRGPYDKKVAELRYVVRTAEETMVIVTEIFDDNPLGFASKLWA